MGATYTRQSTYADGDTITAAHTNDEFDQLLAAFAASSGHTHDGTAAEGGPITKLLGHALTFGAGTSGTDITITFDGESNDGVLKWMEDEDYFEFSDDILIASTEKLQFRDTAIYINSSADGQLDLVADTEIQIAATTIDINGAIVASGEIAAASLDISGAIDVDGTANLDVVDIDGAVDMATTLTVAGNVDFNGDLDVDGTTNLDAVDIDGAVQLDATLTIGANDQGYDVILYGDTASANMTWDTSADDLIFNGAAGLIVPDGQFTLGSTAISSTAAEINIVDGNTSATSTTLADADRVVVNDAGTMTQVALTDFETYFESALDTLSNVTTVGALNSGSITSGFGSIDNGSSAITTTGTVTGGALAVDDVAIDGKVITMTGSSSDTATLTAGTNGTLDIVTTDAGGTGANIQITADGTAELAGTTVTLDSAGGITLDADSGTITFADAGSSLGTITSSGYSGTAAVATVATTVTITDNESTNENNAIVFTSGGDLDGGNIGLESDGDLKYNPSTGTLSATNISVSGTFSTVNSVTMNANNAVVFEGATADAHETTLTSIDATGDRTISLPNVSGTLPVLAAASTTQISSTPEEINLIDGGTARGTTAVASGDGILINDAGTMRMTNVDTVSTYFSSHNVGGSNIVTTGALNSGSITSGFGTIDTGSSNITTTGVGSFGSLDISGAIDVDGTTNLDVVDIDGAVDMASTLTVGGVVSVTDGSAGSPAITNTGDTNTGILFPAADSLAITTGGTQRTLLNGDGFFDHTGGANDVARFSGTNSGSITIRNDTSNQLIMHTGTDDALVFGTGGNNDRLTIDSAGAATFSGTLTAAGTSVFTNLDISGDVDVDGTLETDALTVAGVAAKVAGTETIYVPAAAMYANTTNGCSDLTQVELANGPELKVLDFDPSSDEKAQFTVAFPKSWNEGTITYRVFFTVTGTNTGSVVWELSGVSIADNATNNVTFGTGIGTSAKAHSGTSNDLDVTAFSNAVTVKNAAVDTFTHFQLVRLATNGSDNQSGDARLQGIQILFTTDAANDA